MACSSRWRRLGRATLPGAQHGFDFFYSIRFEAVIDGIEAFADAVVRLYEDASLWNRLSTHGRENIRRHFSMDAARDTVRRIFF